MKTGETKEYRCGCVLGARDPVRLCKRAARLMEAMVEESAALMDDALAFDDSIPGDAAHRLDLHWSKSNVKESA